jgi:competence protein ComEA
MRWWRPDPDGDGVDEEHVQRRLVRLLGGAAPPDPVSAVAVADPPQGDSGGADAREALAVFDPGRRAVRVLAVVALVVAVLVAALVWWSRPRAQQVASAPVLSGAPSPGAPLSGGPEPAGVVVVAVAGRVNRPGLVRLPPGSRVADAIEAAGGAQAGTDLGYVNLARKVVDGELLVIGVSAPPAAPGPGEPAGSGGAVNLNTASLAQLDALPGVGPVLAQRIVDYRTRHGGFRSVEELRKVDGVGDARYGQLKDLVAV